MQRFNQHQRSVLQAFFKVQLVPNKTNLKDLAFQTGLTERQVNKWFIHGRHKAKREKCEPDLSLSEFISSKMVHYDYICIYVIMY